MLVSGLQDKWAGGWYRNKRGVDPIHTGARHETDVVHAHSFRQAGVTSKRFLRAAQGDGALC